MICLDDQPLLHSQKKKELKNGHTWHPTSHGMSCRDTVLDQTRTLFNNVWEEQGPLNRFRKCFPCQADEKLKAEAAV